MNRQSKEDFKNSETLLYNTIRMDICYYTIVSQFSRSVVSDSLRPHGTGNEWSQDELETDASRYELKCTYELCASCCITQGAQLSAL